MSLSSSLIIGLAALLPAAARTCRVTYSVTTVEIQASVGIANTGSSAINGWTLQWAFPGNQQITQLWNGVAT